MGLNLEGLSEVLQTVEPDTLASIVGTRQLFLSSFPLMQNNFALVFLCFDFQMKKLVARSNETLSVSLYAQVFGQELGFTEITMEKLIDIRNVRE